MKTLKLPLLSMCVCLLASCQSNDLPAPQDLLPNAEAIQLDIQEKAVSDNEFAFDLFKATLDEAKEKPSTNVFISPLSVNLALSMTLNGAQGLTADEMKQALRSQAYSLEKSNNHNKALMTDLLKVDPSTQLLIANSIWYKKGFPVKDAFVQTNKNYYDAEVASVDPSNAAKIINDWCAQKTKQKIQKIFDDKLSNNWVMSLVNAVYFKGTWKSRFDKKATKKAVFSSTKGKQQVDMMSQTARFGYCMDEVSRYVELPYGNGAFSMVLILPQEGKTIDDAIEGLTHLNWVKRISELQPHEVELQLPRFKVECNYGLHEKVLPQLGMKVPFDSSADFSLISDEFKQLEAYIGSVIHKTFVEVNEEGTEAAAVTAVNIEWAAAPVTPVSFVVNQPFLFVIRERSSGVILFMGKMGEIKS